MRRAYILLLVALAIAAILAFAAADLRHERVRLLDDFATSQRQLAEQLAEDLHNELREIDEDARLVGSLVQRTSVDGALHDPAASAVVRSSFEALAAIVRPYRLVGLFVPGGPSAVAPDPSERPDTVRDFLSWSAEVAARARRTTAAVLDGPRETGSRQFYVYAVPLEKDRVSLLAADPDQFQQVLVNLLMNSVDACPEGGSITVRLSNEDASSRRVSLEVADSGCGIPQENINAVFDPFFTTKKRGEGTGLGLPVVASIVRNHHAEITLNSHAGVGTTVIVLWPTIAEKEQRSD